MASNSLVFRFIGIDDGASAQFDKLAAKADMTKASMSRFAKGTAVVFGVVAVESLRMAAKFQSSMELIHTQAGASQAQVDSWSKSILNLSGQVATAPEALSEALFHIASTGARGAKAMDELRVAAEGAKVGQADLTDVTNALNATIVSGIKGAGNFAHAMGALNAIVGAGDMHMQDLAEALGSGVLAVVKTFGVNLTQAGAALAVFGDNNIRGAQAATYLRQAVQSISAPSAKADAALGQIHLTVQQLQAALEKNGLTGALDTLHSHFEASGIAANKWGEIMEAAFTKKAGTGITVLLTQFGRYQLKQAEVAEGAKNFGNDWSATTRTLSFQFQRFQADIEAVAVKFGTALIPVALDAMRGLEGIGNAAAATVRFFRDNQAVVIAVAGAITGALIPALAKAGIEFVGLAAKTVVANLAAMRIAILGIATAEGEAAVAGEGWIAAINPVGAALAAVGAVAGVMWAKEREANEKAKQAVDDYANSLNTVTDDLQAQQMKEQALEQALNKRIAALKATFQTIAGGRFYNRAQAEGGAAGVAKATQAYVNADAAVQRYRYQIGLTQKQINTATFNVNKISAAYGLSASQTRKLAIANGIDLTGSLVAVDSGFKGLTTAAELSKSPLKDANANFQTMAQVTSDASTNIASLQNSFNDLVGNFVSMKQSQVDFKNDLVGVVKALAKSHGSIKLNTQAGRDAASAYYALVQQISDVTTKTYANKKSLDAARTAAQGMLSQLEQLPVKGPAVRRVIAGLTKDIAGMSGAANAAGDKVGAALGDGLVSGLRSKYRAVQTEAEAVTAAAINAAKHAGLISSPSKKTMYIGRMLAEGLIGGWTGEAGRIKNTLSTGVQNALNHLDTITSRYLDKEKAKVKAARQALHQDLSSKRSDISSLAGTVSQGADLSNVFGTDANGNPTVANINTFLGAQVGPLQTFARDMALAAKHGLNKTLLSQIANLGPVQGDQILKQLMAPGAIAQANRSESLIQQYAKQTATTAEDALYKGVLTKDRAAVHEQTKATRELTHAINELKREAAHDVARNVTVTTDGKRVEIAGLTTKEARVIEAALHRLGHRGVKVATKK